MRALKLNTKPVKSLSRTKYPPASNTLPGAEQATVGFCSDRFISDTLFPQQMQSLVRLEVGNLPLAVARVILTKLN